MLVHKVRFLKILVEIWITVLKGYQCESKIDFSCHDAVGSKLVFEELLDHLEVLIGFLIVVGVNVLRVHGIHILINFQVKFVDEFPPNLGNSEIVGSGLGHLVLMSEELSHVVIATAKVIVFGTVLLAFQEDAV